MSAATAEPRRGRPGYDRQGVLDVAVRAFNEFGYDATSMGTLADRLGLSKSAIYHHFPSKDHAARGGARRGARRARGRARASRARRPDAPSARLQYVLAGAVAGAGRAPALRDPAAAAARQHRGRARGARPPPRVRPRGRPRSSWRHGMPASCASDIDPRIAERLLFGMINSIVEWYRPEGPEDASRLAADVLAVAVDGLRMPRLRRDARGRSSAALRAARAPSRPASARRTDATSSSCWLRSTASQRTSPYSSVSRGVICFAVSSTRIVSPGDTGVTNRRFSRPELASTGPGRGIDEQPGRPRHEQVAVRDAAGEERVRGRGLLVHVRVEVVAGERGERLDVLQRDLARRRHDLVADLQLGEALAERVLAARLPTSRPRARRRSARSACRASPGSRCAACGAAPRGCRPAPRRRRRVRVRRARGAASASRVRSRSGRRRGRAAARGRCTPRCAWSARRRTRGRASRRS